MTVGTKQKLAKINNNGPSIELEVLHDLLDIY
jgi:hypothetical protein